MEIIHCFTFIMVFFGLAVGTVNLVYSIQLSISLVRMSDWMKKRLAEIEEGDDEEDEEPSKEPVLTVGNYAVDNYAIEKYEE